MSLSLGTACGRVGGRVEATCPQNEEEARKCHSDRGGSHHCLISWSHACRQRNFRWFFLSCCRITWIARAQRTSYYFFAAKNRATPTHLHGTLIETQQRCVTRHPNGSNMTDRRRVGEKYATPHFFLNRFFGHGCLEVEKNLWCPRDTRRAGVVAKVACRCQAPAMYFAKASTSCFLDKVETAGK